MMTCWELSDEASASSIAAEPEATMAAEAEVEGASSV